MNADLVCGSLAEPARLRTYSAVVLGARTPNQIAEARAFIRDGRLTGFPTFPAKIRIVLEYLVNSFEPGRRYPEAEVNAILNTWHEDHAALRRHLVDYQLLTRNDGVYRLP